MARAATRLLTGLTKRPGDIALPMMAELDYRMRAFVLLALMSLVALPTKADVWLNEVNVTRTGSWYGGLFENSSPRRLFCAAGTDSVVGQNFRIVIYPNADAFVEVIDRTWDFADGDDISFAIEIESVRLDLEGQSWITALTWDLVDPTLTQRLFESLSSGSQIDVLSQSDSLLARFSLNGSRTSIEAMLSCLDELRG